MAELTKKQYLDLAGLKTFWGIIKHNFVSEVTMTDITASGVSFNFKQGSGEKTRIGTIPMATSNKAGLMSAAQAKTVDEFSEGVAALVPFTDLKVKGTSATLTNRAANIDFVYDSNKKSIDVVDLNNNSAVLTSIDAKAFIKDGMIDSVVFDTEGNSNDLVITFNTDAGKEAIVLPLDKLVDVYTGGNGISVDGQVISVNLADTYLTADTTGLKVADALWTKVRELDNAVADAAAQGAADAAATAQSEAIAKATELATAAKEAAQKYADDLITGEDGVYSRLTALEGDTHKHDNKEVLDDIDDDKVNAWDSAEANANAYTNTLIGDALAVEGTGTVSTVKGYVDTAITGANGYADAAAKAAYDAIEAIPLTEITLDKLDDFDI